MNTYIEIPIKGVVEKKRQPSLTYALDLDSGRIKGKIDGIKAVEQFIRKALITPRFKCLIYDNQYGSELKQVLTVEDASEKYIEAELPRIVRDAIIHDDRILDVSSDDFEVKFLGDRAFIKCSVDTIFGKVMIEEVISSV
ncbi:MAG: DUF2634 domain-containing protein [Monoglobales bacterium]